MTGRAGMLVSAMEILHTGKYKQAPTTKKQILLLTLLPLPKDNHVSLTK